MTERLKKATFSLSPGLLAALSVAVSEGAAPSKNALVERALSKEIKEIRYQAERAGWEAAMRDPLFLQDVEEVETAFRTADAESARRLR